MNKKISVLMGVYNCENTLAEAIDSIIQQTYTNWELIICDDGSNDNTLKIAMEYAEKDSRIRILKNNKNIGLNATLNRCWKNATGDYIARMDGDDISLIDRFEKEIEVLTDNPDIQIVSCPMILFDEKSEWGRTKSIKYPKAEDIICGTAICHAPVMMQRICMEKAQGYSQNPKTLRVEDVDLWLRLYEKGYRCCNIQEPLYKMRNDQNALNRRKYKYRINETYVKLKACKCLKLGVKYYLIAFKPMIVGLVPAQLRNSIRRVQYNEKTI